MHHLNLQGGDFAGRDFDAEALDVGGGFFGLGFADEGPVGGPGMLEDDGAGVDVGVADGVGGGLALFGGLSHDAFGDAYVTERLAGAFAFAGDVDGIVHGVGEQALFFGADGVEDAFAGEGIGVEDGEAASVKGVGAGVLQPDGAEGRGLVGVPEGDALGANAGVEDGHERGLVLGDADAIFDGVFEEPGEFLGGA